MAEPLEMGHPSIGSHFVQSANKLPLMQHSYDPDVAPDPSTWLAWDEQERIQLVEAYHQRTKVRLPNAKAHAAFHAIVENQIAESFAPVVNAMERLSKQGLSRHDCIHAIGSVLAKHLYELATSEARDSPETMNARYSAAVERLDGKAWLNSNSK